MSGLEIVQGDLIRKAETDLSEGGVALWYDAVLGGTWTT